MRKNFLKIAKNGRSITLSIKWPLNLLRSINWVKGKGILNPALYDKKIAEIVFELKIFSYLILNFG